MKKYEVVYNYENGHTAINLAEEIVAEMNEGNYNNLDDCIWYTVDSSLMYWEDQWKLMREYQEPKEANLYEAIEMLVNDIYASIECIEEEDEEDEEDEEEEQ